MKKILLLLTILPMLFASCENNLTTVKGTFADAAYDGKTIYLYSMNLDSVKGPVKLDSATINAGKFELKAKDVAIPSLGIVGLADEAKDPQGGGAADAFVVFEKGTVNVAYNGQKVIISGTQLNDSLNIALHSLMNKSLDMQEEIKKAGGVQAVPTDADGNDMQTRMQNLGKEMQKGVYSFVKSNMKNAVGETFFVIMQGAFQREQTAELIALSDSTFQNRDIVKQQKEMLEYQIQKEARIVGHPFTDTELVNLKGNKEKLSSYVGKDKYVLIDFWASWCGPCIQSMPHLVTLYDKYKSKGFEIVGISLDRGKEEWEHATVALNMTWPQFFDEDQAAAQTYEVSAVPYTLLVGKDGNVIAINLDSDELEDKLEELLK